ncbi:MAG TPA: matrixin family metalloprotease [Myxococcaceae bacterium]|nr:matrixin family metalloprotease [Myxococcaceae bacterium]
MRTRRFMVLTAFLVAAAASATPTGHSWRNVPVHYSVYFHARINGVPDFQASAYNAVVRGFNHWNSPNIACTRWQAVSDGAFSQPSDRTAINPGDRRNLVIWLGGNQWTHDDATLAVTSVTYDAATGEIFDADMELNDNRVWKVGGSALAADVESLITHEAGHFLGLDHSANTSAIMFADYAVGDVKTTLTPQDVNDVCTVYPATASAGGQGAFCSGDANCAQASPVCRGAVGSTRSSICTVTCETDATCPQGFTCQDASPSGRACLRAPGVPDLCRFCASGDECRTGRCVTDGRRNWCTTLCETSSDCGTGYDCVSAGNFKVCAPQGAPARCPQAQCQGPAECAPGYACANGMCEATGSAGDRCEIADYCASCSVCVGSSSEAYCRTCCGGQNAGGICNNCQSNTGTCGTNQACAELASVDKACVPTVGAQSCQACDGNTPCQNGLQCLGGRCHAACNPLHPGNCNACQAVASGVGYCACPDETAYTGQVCEPPPGAFLACVNGNACVGSPKTCRARCTIGDPSSCPTGQSCATVEGQAVCTAPVNQPGQRCGTSQGVSCGANSCAAGLVCYSGRCYERCDPLAPGCAACVVISNTEAVCACEDQRVGTGQTCGTTRTGLAACSPGNACTAQYEGTCRPSCDPAQPKCATGEACRRPYDSYVCVASGADGGVTDGGVTDGGTGAPDGGTGPGNPGTGCGCSGTSGWLAAWPLLALAFGLFLRRGHLQRSRD